MWGTRFISRLSFFFSLGGLSSVMFLTIVVFQSFWFFLGDACDAEARSALHLYPPFSLLHHVLVYVCYTLEIFRMWVFGFISLTYLSLHFLPMSANGTFFVPVPQARSSLSLNTYRQIISKPFLPNSKVCVESFHFTKQNNGQGRARTRSSRRYKMER